MEIPPPLLCPNKETSEILSLFSTQSNTKPKSFSSLEKLLLPKASRSVKFKGSETVVPLCEKLNLRKVNPFSTKFCANKSKQPQSLKPLNPWEKMTNLLLLFSGKVISINICFPLLPFITSTLFFILHDFI